MATTDLETMMTGMAPEIRALPPSERRAVLQRGAIIALVAFLTLIDLFGSQALLPALVVRYGVSPAAMGVAVNASAFGMAAASFAVAIFARRIDRRRGIWISLALLAVPTTLLAGAEDLWTFTTLRIVQGVLMATAFTLTVTYLSERCAVTAIGGAMAAYITGNVASNLVGRLLAAGIADAAGLSVSFYAFAVLNLAGAAVAWAYFRPGGVADVAPDNMPDVGVIEAWRAHLSDGRLRATFAIGFILLFIFVAAFSYANFVLANEPFALPAAALGLVYLVFLPSMVTTPAAAGAIRRFGPRASFMAGIAASLTGLALLLVPSLPAVLAGLTLVGAGLFFSQSVATTYVGRTATQDRAAANGLYLASYYAGGVSGAWIMGLIFEAQGWTVFVLVLAALCLAAGWLGRALRA